MDFAKQYLVYFGEMSTLLQFKNFVESLLSPPSQKRDGGGEGGGGDFGGKKLRSIINRKIMKASPSPPSSSANNNTTTTSTPPLLQAGRHKKAGLSTKNFHSCNDWNFLSSLCDKTPVRGGFF